MTDTGDFQAVLDRIDKLLREMDEKLKQADSAYHRGMQLLDEAEEFLGAGVVSGLKRTMTNLKHQLHTTTSQLSSPATTALVHAGPITTMKAYDDEWFAIRDLANTVAAAIEHPNARFKHLAGNPATKYFDTVAQQEAAARRMALLANLAGTSLEDMAFQGILFYTAIATALGVAIVGVLAAIIGFGSVVGSPIGAAGIATAVGATILFLGAAANFYAQQEKIGTVLGSEATNPGIGFSPGPTWPKKGDLPAN